MSEKFFYMHGQATPDLQTFTQSLLAILCGTAPTLNWRTPELQHAYIHFRNSLGEERVSHHIQSRMMGHTMALLENDFSYNAIMPFGGEMEHAGGGLSHFCLWSNDGNLFATKYVDKVININFPGIPALVFMHDDTHKSVKTIEHAHIVVDMENEKVRLHQRYFDNKDFSV